MNALTVASGEKQQLADIQGGLEDLQSIVGGTIDVISPYEDGVIFILNDEGE